MNFTESDTMKKFKRLGIVLAAVIVLCTLIYTIKPIYYRVYPFDRFTVNYTVSYNACSFNVSHQFLSTALLCGTTGHFRLIFYFLSVSSGLNHFPSAPDSLYYKMAFRNQDLGYKFVSCF